MPRINVGNLVRTPDGHLGYITERRSAGRNRADKIDKRFVYHVPSPRSGSPVVWWYAWQLIREKEKKTT